MMRTVSRFLLAALCAALLHLFLAALFFSCRLTAPGKKTMPQLPLTVVALSFSEIPDETAAPLDVPPASAVTPSRPMRALPAPDAHPIAPPAFSTPSPDTFPVSPKPPEIHVSALEPVHPEAPAPDQARIQTRTEPALRKNIQPRYPRRARARGEQGAVTLELCISAQGLVDTVRILKSCGSGDLEEAAVQAARLARFTPASEGDRAVPARVRLTLTFRLNDSLSAE
jgi:protein TonB